MLNPFLWYGTVWSVVLILYSFHWSDLCLPLNEHLLFFLILSIILSFIFAYILRKKFKYIPLTVNNHKNAKLTVLLTVLYLLNMIYARNVPLYEILVNNDAAAYLRFDGVPILGVFVMSATFLYGIYLINIFVCFPSKKTFIEILVIFLLFTLQYNRQNLLILFLAFPVFYFARKKLSIKNIISLGIIVMFGLYVFGGLGNIRHGYDWNDSRFCLSLGCFNDSFPKFIPEQFSWTYIYIVSPLANLNYNIEYFSSSYENFIYLLSCFIPEYISKRLPFTIPGSVHLIREYYTVSSTYSPPYIYGGFLGVYLMFFMLFFVVFFVLFLQKKSNSIELSNVIFFVLIYFLFMTFFANSFKFTNTSILIIYIIALLLINNTKKNRKKRKWVTTKH